MKKLLLIVLSFFPVCLIAETDCGCDHVIKPDQVYIDGNSMDTNPGDVICIQAGKYKYINFFNFSGSKDKPLIFKNCGGQVLVGGNQHYYGIILNNVNYYRFTGTGDADYKYGIKVNGVTKVGSGLAGYGTDGEIDHLEISNTGFAGILYKVDPNCNPDTWAENFVMRNISIHDNYLHDTHGEGIYLGYTGSSKTLNCDDKEILVRPHDLEGVRVYKNRIEDTGWDGLQVSRAVKDCEIFDNVILNFGKENKTAQRAGIVIGGGTTGKLYSNWIENGKGGGIHVYGAGDNFITNNIILNVGEDGIFCDDRSTIVGRGFYFVNNTIIRPTRTGMRMYSDESTGNVFYNNIVVSPEGKYIELLGENIDWKEESNLLVKDIEEVRFMNVAEKEFDLQVNSPAVNSGKDVNNFGVHKDFKGISRPKGNNYDIGAYEF